MKDFTPMYIERECENCKWNEKSISYSGNEYNECMYNVTHCDNYEFWQPDNEELVRQDEREKIITDLEYEIQNFNEIRDRKTIDFIHDFIEELKGENNDK